MTIGRVIRDQREALGLTQVDLAALVGVDSRQIGRWENEKQEPFASKCPQIARALSLSLDELHEVIPVGLDLSGIWYAAWDTTRGGEPVIDRHTIIAQHQGGSFSFAADGDYLWTGTLRVVDDALMGTYLASERGAVQHGSLYFRLAPTADSAVGRWSGRSVDHIIGSGWGVIARSEARAVELVEATIHHSGPPTGWLGEDRS